MRLRWMTSAALSLGLFAVAPTMARADRYGGERDRAPVREVRRDHEDRYDRGREVRDRDDRDRRDLRDRDCDEVVSVRDVPGRVIDTAHRAGNGRQVESVRFVRHDGREFYVLEMEHHGWKDITVRVAADGCLIDAVK